VSVRAASARIASWPALVLLLATGLIVLVFSGPAARARPGAMTSKAPIGAHSMLYLNTPFSAMRAMFEQAAAMGASWIRLDIELTGVFPGAQPPRGRSAMSRVLTWSPLQGFHQRQDPLGHPDWGGVDEYMRLARRYHLHVLAVLTTTPPYMAACPAGTPPRASYRCPPKDPGEWARAAGEIAAHTRPVIDDFEILNEPDGRWSFLGSPHQYAALLSDSYKAIHAADPSARVALGGLMHIGPRGVGWMNEMLATGGTDAVDRFDISNIHLRVPPPQVAGAVCQWRTYFASKGFRGPLWVTETGYPAEPSKQTVPGYRDGPPAQARWLSAVIPAMLADGVAKIFVTERDWGRGRFASEGVLHTPNPLLSFPQVKRLPGFYAVRGLDRGAWLTAETAYSRHQTRTASSGPGSC
jgi:hypothetical protein